MEREFGSEDEEQKCKRRKGKKEGRAKWHLRDGNVGGTTQPRGLREGSRSTLLRDRNQRNRILGGHGKGKEQESLRRGGGETRVSGDGEIREDTYRNV